MDKEADCARGVADEHSAREAKERDAREAERPRGEITNVIHQLISKRLKALKSYKIEIADRLQREADEIDKIDELWSYQDYYPAQSSSSTASGTNALSRSNQSYYSARSSFTVASWATARSHPYSSGTSARFTEAPEYPQVSSSRWLSHLNSRGIILDPADELDWSGRGQHVEYDATEEEDIPLQREKHLGHSATAIVESVICRRIRLARKTIRCNRRLRKTEAIAEVEHLQRVQHKHVVRVVGTYTFKNDLCILLYPAAEWNLEEYMEDTLALARQYRERSGTNPSLELVCRRVALLRFFGCLSYAMDFLSSKAIKHMDLKPKNLLVHPMAEMGAYKIYIADFGIARSYQSAAESETDSPTPFTRKYAAPEVVLQETRGFKADIFSLGCIYVEMVATVATIVKEEDQREALRLACRTKEGDTSYQANINAVIDWYLHAKLHLSSLPFSLRVEFLDILPNMLLPEPKDRPTAKDVCQSLVDGYGVHASCWRCDSGPEPFEAATTETAGSFKALLPT